MDDFNPYAAPEADLTPVVEGQFWRDGPLLVMTKDATLPDRCVKCNAPTTWRLKRNLSWHKPGWYLFILIYIIVYIVVAMLVRYTAVVNVPLCPIHRARRWKFLAAGWAISLGALGVLFGGAASGTPYIGWVVLASAIVLITGFLVGVLGSQAVSPKRMDRYVVWLKGAGPAFLDSIPDGPVI